MDLFDTIAAVSTPRGKGGIAVIRISGSEAFSVAEKIFIPKNKKPLSQVKHASAVYGDILSGTPEMNIIDDGIATVFKAPNSFTGEDTVEISCHGGVLITQRVLEAALLSGARGAMPGEYTKRAFVNGKTNLAKTEAVSGLIEAETDAQIRIFSSGSVAALEGTVNSIKDDILSVMTQMYAKIDYPEEDLSDIPRDMLSDTVDSLLTRCVKLKNTYRTGYAVTNGIKCVICGKANAGKSTLYNALLGYEAAIVTDIRGTTRDVLEHTLAIGNMTLKLFDTAGLRDDATDSVELIGIKRTEEAIENAELVLALFDSSAPLDVEDIRLIERLRSFGGEIVAVISKQDIESKAFDSAYISGEFKNVVYLSAKDGKIDALKQKIESLFLDESLSIGKDAVIIGARQSSAIEGAVIALTEGLNATKLGFGEDICAMYLESALTSLSELDGRSVSEEIVDGIFSKFCVGK